MTELIRGVAVHPDVMVLAGNPPRVLSRFTFLSERMARNITHQLAEIATVFATALRPLALFVQAAAFNRQLADEAEEMGEPPTHDAHGNCLHLSLDGAGADLWQCCICRGIFRHEIDARGFTKLVPAVAE